MFGLLPDYLQRLRKAQVFPRLMDGGKQKQDCKRKTGYYNYVAEFFYTELTFHYSKGIVWGEYSVRVLQFIVCMYSAV